MTFKDYRVIGVNPDISKATFLTLLQNSPAFSAGAEVYDYCVKRRVSPLFLLAMFQHESTMGKFGFATKTHSFGNTRPPSFGVVDNGVYNQDTGVLYARGAPRPSGRYLSAYGNWKDGGISTVARLVEHLPYEGKKTVREIIYTWAPPTDSNNTEAYIASVLMFIHTHIGSGFPNAVQPDGHIQIGPVDFGGVLNTVSEVVVRGVNPDGTRYERIWRLDGLQPWTFWE